MAKTVNLVGFDCGNSSYRVVLGRFDGRKIAMETVFQQENRPIRVGNVYYWDILGIFAGLKQGLAAAVLKAGGVDSIGICTWGIDFSLLDARGNLIGNSLCYRNPFGQEQLDSLSDADQRRLFDQTGILCDRINTIYMLMSMKTRMPEILSIAERLLMVPDVFNYLFCGQMANEPSELSTTQLMDSRTRRINPEVCARFGINAGLFGPITSHGEVVGMVRRDICDEVGLARPIPVVAVPSHDTASAVLAVPAGEGERFAFVSAGTWSLIGVELKEPIIDDAVYGAGLTNEVGAFDRITLLKNNAGMFIIQRLREEFEAVSGRRVGWAELMALAEKVDADGGEPPLVNVNHGDFFSPEHMGRALWRHLVATGQARGDDIDWPVLFAAFHHSLAAAYAVVVDDLEHVSGGAVDNVHVVGGGSRNELLNRLAADCTGRTVAIGSPESASLGNIAAQLRHFDPSLDIGELRRIVGNSLELKRYAPARDGSPTLARYRRLIAGD